MVLGREIEGARLGEIVNIALLKTLAAAKRESHLRAVIMDMSWRLLAGTFAANADFHTFIQLPSLIPIHRA